MLRILALLWLVSGCLFTLPAGRAQEVSRPQCEDLIYVRAQEQKGFLDFPGSPFKSMVKVTITYRSVKDDTMGDERLYEDLWYQGQNPLGCRRYRDFDLRPKDRVFVYLTASSPAELSASANALVRILLDANLNRDAIVGVAVPAESFWPLVDCMEVENFYRAGKLNVRPAVYISLPLMSKDGHKTTVVWAESM